MTPEAWQKSQIERGMPEGAARMLASGFASRATLELAAVDPSLEELVGRPLRTVAETLPLLLRGPATRSQ